MTDDNETFEQATSFVASHADHFSEDALLKFYGFYKQAIDGPCTTQKPSIFDFKGRSKWAAWNKLGDLPSDHAAQHYIILLTSLHPSWNNTTEPSNSKNKPGGVGGPVFSSLASEIQPPDDDTSPSHMPDLIAAVCDNDIPLIKQILSIEEHKDELCNERDSEGCTALHFAADHGAVDIVHILLKDSTIDINAVDHDGQTALHYATLAEQRECYELLQKMGANTQSRNADGKTARDIAPAEWHEVH